MYITKEELEQRLKKTELFIKERERKVRGSVKTNNPEKRLEPEERALIGSLAELDTNKNIAELFGVSAQTVSNNSRGLVSPTIGLNKELRDQVEQGKEENNKKLQEKLLDNLSLALSQVSENISGSDALEASKIAVSMSTILDRVSGKNNEGKGNRTAIIINVPPMKEEKNYQVITV